MLYLRQLTATALVLLARLGSSHRTIPEGTTCGLQFSTAEDPLVIPDPSISWATYRNVGCDGPVIYLSAELEESQPIAITIGVPEIERLAPLRPRALITGPGLPALTSEELALLPDEVAAPTGANGGIILESPVNQSTCEHLDSEPMAVSATVKDDRCHFYEPFGGSNSWVLIDYAGEAADAGEYTLATWIPGPEGGDDTQSGKIWVACCEWPEDFATPFDFPEPECSTCGANTETRNMGMGKWMEAFYEQNGFEGATFPPVVSCSSKDAATSNEGAETGESLVQCREALTLPDPPPNEMELWMIENADSMTGMSTPGLETSSPPTTGPALSSAEASGVKSECVLHGNSPELHSHNAFGGCEYPVEWTETGGRFEDAANNGGDLPATFRAFVGDTLSLNGGAPLFEVASEEALKACDLSAAVELSPSVEGFKFDFSEAGNRYLIGDAAACAAGAQLEVELKDASEGLFCHEHTTQRRRLLQGQACTAPGTVAIRMQGEAGEMFDGAADECIEFCSPSFVTNFMQGAEEGSCADAGFSTLAREETKQPVGSPMAVDITVFTAGGAGAAVEPGSEEAGGEQAVSGNAGPATSECHCHSYEEIECGPEGDALYEEHVLEIQEYCVDLEDASTCPYKCMQPWGVLHLHYKECSLREPFQEWLAVSESLCHVATDAPSTKCEDTMLGELAEVATISTLSLEDYP